MPLKLGTDDVDDLKLGSSQVDKIYLGSDLVWNAIPDIVFHDPSPINNTSQWSAEANMTLSTISGFLRMINSSTANDEVFSSYFEVITGVSYNFVATAGSPNAFTTIRFQHQSGGTFDTIQGSGGSFNANFTPTKTPGRLWLLPSSVNERRLTDIKVEIV